jgi:hypothetical protein
LFIKGGGRGAGKRGMSKRILEKKQRKILLPLNPKKGIKAR